MKKAVLIIAALLLAVPLLRAGIYSSRERENEPGFSETHVGGSKNALLDIGQRLGGGGAVYVAERQPAPAYPVLLNSPAADFPLRRMVALNLQGFKIPVSAVFAAPPEAMPEKAAEPESSGSARYETEDFLARQAVFSAHSLPESVDCDDGELPFDYACPVSAEISSRFGYRVHPIYGDVRFHYGTDFDVNDGTAICAFADGTVSTAGTVSGYGLTLIIDHGDGYSSLYGHCSELLVEKGETVCTGQLVARSGRSGLVTGPHMHFELRQSGDYLNPEFYI